MNTFEKNLIRETSLLCIAVMVLTMGIFGIVKFLALLRRAVQGELPVEGLGSLLMYKLLTYLDVVLTPVLFITILLVLFRRHRDKEFTIYATAGIGPKQYLIVATQIAIAAATIVVCLACILSPYSEQKFERQLDIYQQSLSNLPFEAGKFRVVGNQSSAIYFGRESQDSFPHSIRLFYLNSTPEKKELIVAQDGSYEFDTDDGYGKLEILDGRRYKLNNYIDTYETSSFTKYFESIPIKTFSASVIGPSSKSTLSLAESSAIDDSAELHWRITKVITIAVVVMLAFAFGALKLSSKAGLHLLNAFGIYFLYASILGFLSENIKDHDTVFVLYVPHLVILLIITWMYFGHRIRANYNSRSVVSVGSR